MILHSGQATCVMFLSLMQEAVERGNDALICRMQASVHAPNPYEGDREDGNVWNPASRYLSGNDKQSP